MLKVFAFLSKKEDLETQTFIDNYESSHYLNDLTFFLFQIYISLLLHLGKMLKVLAFLSKKEDLETQAFIDYYEKKHIPLILALVAAAPLAKPISYKRNYIVHGHTANYNKGI
jgi:hypothetical protein